MISYAIKLQNNKEPIAAAFNGIPANATHLDLSWILWKQNASMLANSFALIPTSVTHLDLSYNELHLQTDTELAIAFASIPKSVKHIDLSENHLGYKKVNELNTVFAGINPGTTIFFKMDNILSCKTHDQRDALLIKLREAAPHLTIDSLATINHTFLLKCMTRMTGLGLFMALIGALILASIIILPVSPVIIGAALITTGVCSSGFFAYQLKNHEVPDREDRLNPA